MLSETIKLVKGGLKNLNKRTVARDKSIKDTNNSEIILVVLNARFLITHTNYYLNRSISFPYSARLLYPINALSTDFATCLPSLIAQTTSD